MLKLVNVYFVMQTILPQNYNLSALNLRYGLMIGCFDRPQPLLTVGNQVGSGLDFFGEVIQRSRFFFDFLDQNEQLIIGLLVSHSVRVANGPTA